MIILVVDITLICYFLELIICLSFCFHLLFCHNIVSSRNSTLTSPRHPKKKGTFTMVYVSSCSVFDPLLVVVVSETVDIIVFDLKKTHVFRYSFPKTNLFHPHGYQERNDNRLHWYHIQQLHIHPNLSYLVYLMVP